MNRNRDALIIAVLVAAFASFAGCATEPEVAGDRGAPAPLVEAHERVEAGSQKNARGRADHDGDGDDQSRSRDDDHGDGGRGEHHDDDDHQGNEEGGHDHHDHDGDEDCDSPALEVQVDPSLSPEVEDYVEPDGLSFRHARITYDDGANDFISNQLVLYDVSTRDLRQVLRRWRGRVVREIAAGRPEPDGYLVEVDPSTAHPEHFARDLERILGERPTGTLTFSSDEALATVVIAAAEAAEGRTVGVNVVMRPAGLDNARVTEGPMGAPLAPGSGALYSPNPFNWVNFSATLGAHHGVPQAWQFLAQNGPSSGSRSRCWIRGSSRAPI